MWRIEHIGLTVSRKKSLFSASNVGLHQSSASPSVIGITIGHRYHHQSSVSPSPSAISPSHQLQILGTTTTTTTAITEPFHAAGWVGQALANRPTPYYTCRFTQNRAWDDVCKQQTSTSAISITILHDYFTYQLLCSGRLRFLGRRTDVPKRGKKGKRKTKGKMSSAVPSTTCHGQRQRRATTASWHGGIYTIYIFITCRYR